MNKIDANKQQKLEALYRSAYELFIEQGIEKTTVADITRHAGIAKGTFYLYFRDKYEARDRLISKISRKLFLASSRKLEKHNIQKLEDRIIFFVDDVLSYMEKHQEILRFISKNLSWGIFRKAVSQDNSAYIEELFKSLFENQKIREPEIMLFMIIELASSTSFSTILEDDPVSFRILEPYLNEAIRSIIHSHLIQQ